MRVRRGMSTGCHAWAVPHSHYHHYNLTDIFVISVRRGLIPAGWLIGSMIDRLIGRLVN